jgi:hypothetical protein
MNRTTRLMLPFTHGVEMDAIEAVVLLAASHQATLVSLSLISVPQVRGKGARLEHIQQSKDFLEAVQHKALRHQVPLERFEVFTGNVVQSMLVLVDQLRCDGILLVLHGQSGSLLSAEAIGQLKALRSCPLYLIHLPSRESSWVSRLRERISHCWPRHQQRAGEQVQRRPAPGEWQVDQQVALPRYSGSPDLVRTNRP